MNMMMYDVLSLGPARMDVFVELPEDEVTEVCTMDRKRCMIELGFGEKIAVRGMQFCVGGNAGNNAVGLARMGFKAAIVGAIGDGWTDQQAKKILEGEGVDTSLMETKSGQNGFGVIINYQGERTILSYYAQALCCWPSQAEISAKWIYLTSMGKGYEEFYRDAVSWAVGHGAKIAFNPGTRQLKDGLEKLRYAYERTEILFVNREEGEELMGLATGSEVKEVLAGLKQIGPKVVIVTDGNEGSYLFDGENYWQMPIVPAPVVERTGAGDAFGSGFLAALMRGKNYGEALKWGTINSASVLGTVGPQGGLLTPQKVEEWMEKTGEIKAEEI